MVTWSCPHCGHEYRVAEDGSVMIYPLNVYRTKNSCEFCGAIKNAGFEKINMPTRPIYPNPYLEGVAAYAGPDPSPTFIPYWQAEDSNTTTTVTIGAATSSPDSSKRAKIKISKASSSNG